MTSDVFEHIVSSASFEPPARLLVEPADWPDPPAPLAGRQDPVQLEDAGPDQYVVVEPGDGPRVPGAAFPRQTARTLGSDCRQAGSGPTIAPEELPARVLCRARIDQRLAHQFTRDSPCDYPTKFEEPRACLETVAEELRSGWDHPALDRLVQGRITYQLRYHTSIIIRRLSKYCRPHVPAEERAEPPVLRDHVREWSKHSRPEAGCVNYHLERYARAGPPLEHFAPFVRDGLDSTTGLTHSLVLIYRWPSDRVGFTLLSAICGRRIDSRREALTTLLASSNEEARSIGHELLGRLEVPAGSSA